MECWQLQFNRVEEVCKLNISFIKDKFSLPRATGPPLSEEEQHKLAAQKTFFPNFASRQMKTKLYFSF